MTIEEKELLNKLKFSVERVRHDLHDLDEHILWVQKFITAIEDSRKVEEDKNRGKR